MRSLVEGKNFVNSNVGHDGVDLSAAHWAAGERERYLARQNVVRSRAGVARGYRGAVTVACNGYAARAGVEALRQGGTAIDAAMTSALTQVALTGGASVSYFGIMSLVYFDAASGTVHTMNADWNTLRAEHEPLSIPGGIALGRDGQVHGSRPSGRTALVGGFLKGVEAAHRRFGRLPFASLFGPSIELAEQGFRMDRSLHRMYDSCAADLARLPATRAIFFKPDGSRYVQGETWCQPQLAETLRRVAQQGADYIYRGAWGARLLAAVRADGSRMTRADLEHYDVIWADALVGDIGDGYNIATAPWPNAGGVAMIEAQNLARVAGLTSCEHWITSPDALRKALDISIAINLLLFAPAVLTMIFPGIDFSPEARITLDHARKLWPIIENGALLGPWKRARPMHSDNVVAIDADGNIAAVTHSINTVHWGRTAINIDGISIGDPASFQQDLIALTGPGARLPAPTETGILFENGKAILGFASMGPGLHARTMQCLLNVARFGMGVGEAIDTADFYQPSTSRDDGSATALVPEGRFDPAVLDATGYAWREVTRDEGALGGEGKWIAISRDPETGALEAASHNRNNSDAVAF